MLPHYQISSFANLFLATGLFQVSADIALACQLSAPFDQKLSIEQIYYFVPYINFESDLAYLKNPPSTYLISAVDILGDLNDIRQNASAGIYTNQYAFDAAITNLVGKAHNGHFTYTTGLIAAFEHHNIMPLVSISKDGLALPHVYVASKSLSCYAHNTRFLTSFTRRCLQAINKFRFCSFTSYLYQWSRCHVIPGACGGKHSDGTRSFLSRS